MIQITLYNIGGYKKKQVFYCFVGFFCIHFICIPDIIKISRRHVFGRKNISASMLRIYKNKNRITLRALGLYVYHLSIYLLRRTFPHRVSTLYLNQSIMASPCKSCIQKNRCMCFKKHIYIMYIYINSTLVSTIHITYKKIFVADETIQRCLCY